MQLRSRPRRQLTGLLAAAGLAAGFLAGGGPAAAAPVPTGAELGAAGARVGAVGRLAAGSEAEQSALIAAYASYRHIPRRDIAGVRAGSLRVTRTMAGQTQWAAASFLPDPRDPGWVQAGFQDGAGIAVFTRRDSGPWRALRVTGSRPLGCLRTLPPAVRRAWHLKATAGCAPSRRLRLRVPRMSPSAANPATIAAIAEQNVGIGDTPASTSFSFDCNPFTTMVGVGAGSSGCGTDPHFGVVDENEEWCADFTKWVWEQGGVTADLGTLDPAAASFYTWGQQQGETMPTDPSDPAPGDAVVFYPAGTAPNGGFADHVGIVASVNPDGTVNLVNGDFSGSTNITVQANNGVNLGPWSAAIWGSGEQWIFVTPGQPLTSPNGSLFGLAPNNSAVSEYNGTGAGPGAWTVIGGPATKLYAGGYGLFAVNPNNGSINMYNGTPGSWTEIGGPGASFAVTNNAIYGLGRVS